MRLDGGQHFGADRRRGLVSVALEDELEAALLEVGAQAHITARLAGGVTWAVTARTMTRVDQ